jgi:streptogramin lyase
MRRAIAFLLATATLVVPAAARADITHFPLPAPAGDPISVAQAPNGDLWFAEDTAARVGRLTPIGAITEFSASPLTRLSEATFGPDGRLWLTGGASDRLGRATVGDSLGAIGSWAFGQGCSPAGVTTGTDGFVWFTKLGCDVVARVDPASTPNGALSGEWHLPSGTDPQHIAVGPDGAIWFTAEGSGRLGRIANAAQAAPTWPVSGLQDPWDLVTGPDGNLWVTETGGGGSIARVTPSGTITRFSAGLPANADPREIAVGGDGSLYFTDYGADAIGRITTGGTITELPLPAGSAPRGIAAAADGSLWFAEHGSGSIGHLTLAATAPPAPPAATEPQPVLGETVVASVRSGTVRVTLPGASHATVLHGTDDIPVGSVVDASRGRLRLKTALPGNGTQQGSFWGGVFQVKQSHLPSLGGLTTLRLRTGHLTCPAGASAARASAAATRKRKRSNSLWGSDSGGRFRTHGRNATATVRGTQWHTTDSCAGTRVTVRSGAVLVRDSLRHRNVVVRAGHSYLARTRH